MFPHIIADSSQLSTLASVLNRHCMNNNVTDEAERNKIAQQIVVMFGQGIESEDALAARLRHERR